MVAIFLLPNKTIAANTDIVINEIGAFEASDYEWFEIYNKGSAPVDMTGWKFYENATNHGLVVYQGSDAIIEPSEYAIIANIPAKFLEKHPTFAGTIFDSSWVTLDEDGETIALKTSSVVDAIVESFTYLPCHNFSLERKDPKQNDYSIVNWQEHLSSDTAGLVNSNFIDNQNNNSTSTNSTSTNATSTDSGTNTSTTNNNVNNYIPNNYAVVNISGGAERPLDLVINELLSDPADGEAEWVELYNNTDKEINLAGWTLTDFSGAVTDLSGSVASHGFLSFDNPKGNLNNAGELVILKNKSGTIIDRVVYGSIDDGATDHAVVAHDPNSLARRVDGMDVGSDKVDFVLAKPTKNVPNIVIVETINNETAENNSFIFASSTTYAQVIITELLPYPATSTQEEFIELQNISSSTVDLLGWILGDKTSRKYKLNKKDSANLLLAPQKYLVISKSVSGISLNNTQSESVYLYSPSGQIIDQVFYDKAVKGQAYGLINNEWQWSASSTPEAVNVLEKEKQKPEIILELESNRADIGESIEFDASKTIDPQNAPLNFNWLFGDEATSSGMTVSHIYNKEGKFILTLRATNEFGLFSEIKKNIYIKKPKAITVAKDGKILISDWTDWPYAQLDDLVKLTGTVAVEPGVFGAQYFYMINNNFGAQVYSYKKLFPHLKIGDVVTVSGVLSQTNGEKRIKTKVIDDIQSLNKIASTTPISSAIGDLADDNLGSLVRVVGTILERKGQNIYVDDGTGEMRILIKANTGIENLKIKAGSILETTGILTNSASGFVLLPRNLGDLQVENIATTTAVNTTEPFLSGVNKYLIMSNLFLLALIIFVVEKNKLKK
ncbi:MAG: lamin tail domain-containing protein [bacterium]